jgi:hypothetical protein
VLLWGSALSDVCCFKSPPKAMKGKKMNATMLRLPPLSKRSFPSYVTLAA